MAELRHVWHFVSRATTGVGTGEHPVLDFRIGVSGAIQDTVPVNGRIVEDPLGGDKMQLIRDSDAPAKRDGTLILTALWGPNRETDRANIMAAWALRGPFDVTTPEGETFGLMFDVVSGQGMQRQWGGGARLYQLNYYEVD